MPHRPDAGSRSPEEIEAAIAEIERILCLESSKPYPEPSRTRYQPEPDENGLIVVDGPDMIPPWLRDPPCGPPPPSNSK